MCIWCAQLWCTTAQRWSNNLPSYPPDNFTPAPEPHWLPSPTSFGTQLFRDNGCRLFASQMPNNGVKALKWTLLTSFPNKNLSYCRETARRATLANSCHVSRRMDGTYNFLSNFHCSHVSILHCFWNVGTYFPKFKKVTWLNTSLLRVIYHACTRTPSPLYQSTQDIWIA